MMSIFYLMDGRDGQQVVMVRGDIVSFVPADEANPDYVAYLEWVAEGNTPEPWPPAE